MKRLPILFLFFAFSEYCHCQSEADFWQAFLQENYATASQHAEALIETKFDYLYLGAVASHLDYDYDRYHGMSDYYKQNITGNYKGLEKLLKQNMKDTNPVMLNLLGIIKMLNPEIKLEPAASYFEKSIALLEENAIAYNYLSMIALKDEDLEQGITLAQKAIQFEKTYPEPYNNLAYGLNSMGKKEEAIQTLLSCMKACPVNTRSTFISFISLACKEVALFSDNNMFGVPGFEENKDREAVIEALKDNQESYILLVMEFLQNGSYKEVELLLNAIQPKNDPYVYGMYYYMKGIIGIESKNEAYLDGATDSLAQKGIFDFTFELGNIMLNREEYEAAEKIYKKAMPVATTNEEKMKVHSNFGSMLLRLEKYDEAINILKAALEFSPNDDITLTNIGIGYALKQDTLEAKEYLLKAEQHCQSDNQMEAIQLWLGRMNGN